MAPRDTEAVLTSTAPVEPAPAAGPVAVCRKLVDWREGVKSTTTGVTTAAALATAIATCVSAAASAEWHTSRVHAVDAIAIAQLLDVERAPSSTVAPPAAKSSFVWAAEGSDVDGDTLLDEWEKRFGLDPASEFGDDGPDGDPDADGRRNAQEQADGTHPWGVHTRYLAEGAASSFFQMRIALLNLDGPNVVLLRFMRASGTVAARVVQLHGLQRTTLDLKDVPELAGAEFSTVIESVAPVVVDRVMTWDESGYGSHAEASTETPRTEWYLAEGATHSNFDLFYLLQNPNATSVPVTVTYLRPAPAPPLTKVYVVPRSSRQNIWVNAEARTDKALADLAASDVSAVIRAPQPILVERAMYLTQAGADGQFGTPDDVPFGAGHASAAVAAPSTTWFLAEGATGPYFDEFILIANPETTAADVEVQYLLVNGNVFTKTYNVAPQSRFNIWVNEESFPGIGKALADQALSATLTSLNGVAIIVERSMWWPRPSPTWVESHNSPGTTTTGTAWAVAEGEVGGTRGTETYLLVANTSDFPGSARVTVVIEGGVPQSATLALPPTSRTNIHVTESMFPGVTGNRFGAVIESLGGTPAQIVVERAMYSDANGIRWSAGSNAIATRLHASPSRGLREFVDISPLGGEYRLDNGLTLHVPQGAVAQPTRIGVAPLSPLAVEEVIRAYGLVDRYVLAAFDGQPDGLAFLKPVVIDLPARPLRDTTDLPLYFVVDTTEQIYAMDGSTVTVKPRANQVSVAVTHFSMGVVAALDDYKASVKKEDMERCELQATPDPCRCGDQRVVQEYMDVQRAGPPGSKGCWRSRWDLTVELLGCATPPWKETVEEGLKMLVTVSPASATVNVDGTTTLNASVVDAARHVFHVPVEWSTVNAAIAAITDRAQGLVRGVATGATQVTAMEACGGAGAAVVTVKDSSRWSGPMTMNGRSWLSHDDAACDSEGTFYRTGVFDHCEYEDTYVFSSFSLERVGSSLQNLNNVATVTKTLVRATNPARCWQSRTFTQSVLPTLDLRSNGAVYSAEQVVPFSPYRADPNVPNKWDSFAQAHSISARMVEDSLVGEFRRSVDGRHHSYACGGVFTATTGQRIVGAFKISPTP